MNRTSTRPWLDLALSLRLALRLGLVTVRLAPGVVMPLVRDAFSYFNGITNVSIYQPALIARPSRATRLTVPGMNLTPSSRFT